MWFLGRECVRRRLLVRGLGRPGVFVFVVGSWLSSWSGRVGCEVSLNRGCWASAGAGYSSRTYGNRGQAGSAPLVLSDTLHYVCTR